MSSPVFHEMDSRHLLDIFPKNSNGIAKEIVDVTITSPPYWNLKDYGCGAQIGYRQPYELYLKDLERVFRDVFLVTKNTGSLWIIVDSFTKKDENGSLLKGYETHEVVPLTFDMIGIVKNSGWKLRDILVWQKDKTLPWSWNGKLRNVFEHILFFTKTNNYKFFTQRIRMPDYTQFKEWWVRYPERYSPNGITPTNLWYFPIPVQGSWGRGYIRHFCPFPVPLVERILLLTTNKRNVVFDPFAGSGVVMAVANALGRRSIGMELNHEYLERFRNYVLGDVKKEMARRIKERQRQMAMQKLLRRKIGRLRMTKYPRLLIKKLSLSPERVRDINSIFAIASNVSGSMTGNWKDRLPEDIYVVFESENSNDEIKEAAHRATRKPPLSKFGIEPRLHFLRKDTFISEQCRYPSFDHRNLWLYVKGATNMFYKRMTFQKWVDLCETGEWTGFFKQNIPPIVSNVRIRQSVPSTLVPREK